jgi:ribosomal protein S18 acetylase RimI-like enzyme
VTTELADLPPGYTARRPTIDDAEAILTLVHAQERATIGDEDSTLPEVRELLSLRRTPPETDHWLVMHGDVASAWAMVIDDYGGEQIEIDVYADPAHPGVVREALYDLLIERVREHAAERPNREVMVSVGVHVGDEHSAAALLRRGFAVERRFNRLRIELEPGRPFPSAPDGVALQAFDPGADTDWRDWHTLVDESFSDHWGHEATSLDAFRQSVETEEDPELDRWRFALVDGVRAGICQASGRFATEGGGWIRTLGVVASARGRGAGRYLLEHALASYAYDGRRWAGLSVDTENVSGALRLYESAGMRPWMQIDAYRRRVSAG